MRLAELALDVVVLGEAEAAVGLHGDVRRLPRRIGGEQLGHVGFGAARLAAVEQLGGALMRIRSAASTLTWARAIGNWMPWFWPIGRPNTTRSVAYCVPAR